MKTPLVWSLTLAFLLPPACALSPGTEAEGTESNAGAPAGTMVSGRVMLHALDGSVAPFSGGYLDLEAFEFTPDVHRMERSVGSVTVPVVAGFFRVLAPAGLERLRARTLRARDRRTLIPLETATFDPRAGEAHIEVVEIAPSRLELFAASNEEPLSLPIRVEQAVRVDPRSPNGSRHTLDMNSVTRAGALPYELWPTDLANLDYRIRVDGYGWTWVTIDPQGGERRILLPPAGHIEVALTKHVPFSSGKLLRLRRPGSEAYFEQSINQVRVDSLPVGSWEFTVEGVRTENPLVYASACVEVVEGQTTRVPLELQETPDVGLVPVAGTLFVPPAWEQPPADLVFEQITGAGVTKRVEIPVASLRAVEGRIGAVHFDAGGLEPGLYRVGQAGRAVLTYYEVPPVGIGEVRLELPPPAPVKLFFVDAGTGAPVVPRSVIWHCEWPFRPFEQHGSSGNAFPGPQRLSLTPDGCAEGSIPAALVGLSCFGNDEYKSWSQSVEVPAEGLIQRVELERRTGFLLTCRVDGERLPRRFHVNLHTVSAPAGGGLREAGRYPRGDVYEVALPGTYIIRVVPNFDGSWPLRDHDPGATPSELLNLRTGDLLPVPEREVIIEPGKLTLVEIALPRATGFRLWLTSEAAGVPLPPLVEVVVTGNGSERVLEITPGDDGRTILDPGTYQLSFAKIDGCAPLPPVEVVIAEGKVLEVTVTLVAE